MQIQGLECCAVTVSGNYVAQLYFPFDRTHQEFMRVQKVSPSLLELADAQSCASCNGHHSLFIDRGAP